MNPGGETRTPEQSPPGERGGNWPSYESLDLEKLKSARNMSCDHAPADQKLNGFKPASKKPRHKELWQAVIQRGRNAAVAAIGESIPKASASRRSFFRDYNHLGLWTLPRFDHSRHRYQDWYTVYGV